MDDDLFSDLWEPSNIVEHNESLGLPSTDHSITFPTLTTRSNTPPIATDVFNVVSTTLHPSETVSKCQEQSPVPRHACAQKVECTKNTTPTAHLTSNPNARKNAQSTTKERTKNSVLSFQTINSEKLISSMFNSKPNNIVKRLQRRISFRKSQHPTKSKQAPAHATSPTTSSLCTPPGIFTSPPTKTLPILHSQTDYWIPPEVVEELCELLEGFHLVPPPFKRKLTDSNSSFVVPWMDKLSGSIKTSTVFGHLIAKLQRDRTSLFRLLPFGDLINRSICLYLVHLIMLVSSPFTGEVEELSSGCEDDYPYNCNNIVQPGSKRRTNGKISLKRLRLEPREEDLVDTESEKSIVSATFPYSGEEINIAGLKRSSHQIENLRLSEINPPPMKVSRPFDLKFDPQTRPYSKYCEINNSCRYEDSMSEFLPYGNCMVRTISGSILSSDITAKVVSTTESKTAEQPNRDSVESLELQEATPYEAPLVANYLVKPPCLKKETKRIKNQEIVNNGVICDEAQNNQNSTVVNPYTSETIRLAQGAMEKTLINPRFSDSILNTNSRPQEDSVTFISKEPTTDSSGIKLLLYQSDNLPQTQPTQTQQSQAFKSQAFKSQAFKSQAFQSLTLVDDNQNEFELTLFDDFEVFSDLKTRNFLNSKKAKRVLKHTGHDDDTSTPPELIKLSKEKSMEIIKKLFG
ncbi:hypothetical protein P9112_012420 [Eukaryota sp. TZLM1-RC]